MNTSIFQLAPWSGPAYLALADAIEVAIRAGSVQAGDRLPPQRMLADFLGLHVNTVNRAFRETRQRGLTSGNRHHGTVVLATSLENSPDTLNSESANWLRGSIRIGVASFKENEGLEEWGAAKRAMR